jgi:hypothetical protein
LEQDRCVEKSLLYPVWFVVSPRLSDPPLPLAPTRNKFHNRSSVKNGHIKRLTDPDIQSSVLEICGTNVSTTFVSCPANPKETLGIKLPFLVMVVKNLKKYFTFEVTILDDKNMHRRFRASNYQVRVAVLGGGGGGAMVCRDFARPTNAPALSEPAPDISLQRA